MTTKAMATKATVSIARMLATSGLSAPAVNAGADFGPRGAMDRAAQGFAAQGLAAQGFATQGLAQNRGAERAGVLPFAADDPSKTALPELDDTRRTRLWDFPGHLHCSIIGTCLSTAELRRLLAKLAVPGAAAASDHDLHALGVTLAGRREDGARLLHKALDRTHRGAIARFARADTEAGLLTLWSEALKAGDIPGAYWAALTHPAAGSETVRRVFGDVHMLSHLVGAANRADIRRLAQLEQDNAALAAKIEKQQRQLRDGFAERDRVIAHLTGLLAQRAEEPAAGPADEAYAAREAALLDLNRRLSRETARRERLERQAAEAAAALAQKDTALRAAQSETEALRREAACLEAELAAPPAESDAPEAAGRMVLYVGGRAHQIPQLKMLAARAGAGFLHHDGGIEHNAGLLAGLVGRADLVVFPVDCISHEAATLVKRTCRALAKPYTPLRSASLAALFAALAHPREPVAAAE